MTAKWQVDYTDEFGEWWDSLSMEAKERSTMRHHFSELKAKFTADQRARLDAEAEEMNREYVLSQIRNEVGLTQSEVAEKLSISQPAYAAYEKADNMRVGTLRKIVSALGGVLSFHVELDGRDYSLQMPQNIHV